MHPRFDRRQLLGLAGTGIAGLLIGCGNTRDSGRREPEAPPDAAAPPNTDSGGYTLVDARGPTVGGDAVAPYGKADGRAPPSASDGSACAPTAENILGPYYKAGAPFRTDIREGQEGDLLLLSGVVRAADCVTPLAGALVDIWQANAAGAYDSAGYVLRGRILTDEEGRYELVTLVPGRYLNGDTYRPAHVHYQVSHPRGRLLTTQLYFDGDPFNAVDPFIEPSLIMPLVAERDSGATIYRTQFDVTLIDA